jgi:hypothetical protein
VFERAYDVIVAKPGGAMKIPLSETEALAGLLAVKPTANMPRPGESKREEEGEEESAEALGSTYGTMASRWKTA